MSESNKFLKELFSRGIARSSYKYSLEAIFHVNKKLGLVDKNFNSIHVAGTNGKGSVCTKIYNSLIKSGFKCGVFTSPHISTFRERIVIEDKMISLDEVEYGLAKIFAAEEQKLSFFEVMTLLSFITFAKRGVDFAVIETGLGGRNDATNIITPIVSVITSIGYDHENVLGSTLEEIAQEKAGIIKPSVPVVLGPSVIQTSVRAKARDNLSCIRQVFMDNNSCFDAENTSIAIAVLEEIKKRHNSRVSVLKSLVSIKLKGRFDVITKNNNEVLKGKNITSILVVDVAHNVSAFEKLFFKIKQKFPDKKVSGVIAMSLHKNIEESTNFLSSQLSHVYLLPFTHSRLVSRHQLNESFKKTKNDNRFVFDNLQKGWDVALSHVNRSNEILLVTGSFFMMDEIYRLLGDDRVSDEMEVKE
jgi:dihydrofolate synthase / folylpolyglutamate synthase